MSKTELQSMTEDAIKIYKAIKAIEADQIAPMKEKLEAIKSKIEREMQSRGIKEAVSESGNIIWVDRKGTRKLDEPRIAKALGIDSLEDFAKYGKTVHFLKLNPVKE